MMNNHFAPPFALWMRVMTASLIGLGSAFQERAIRRMSGSIGHWVWHFLRFTLQTLGAIEGSTQAQRREASVYGSSDQWERQSRNVNTQLLS
jgi:hypothetical protein